MAPGAQDVLGGCVADYARVFIPAQRCWITANAYTIPYYTIRKIPVTSYPLTPSHLFCLPQWTPFQEWQQTPVGAISFAMARIYLIYMPFGQTAPIVLKQILNHGETTSTPSHKRCRDGNPSPAKYSRCAKSGDYYKRMNHTGATVTRMYNFSQSTESWAGVQIATQPGA
jgi:hypothetical protein